MGGAEGVVDVEVVAVDQLVDEGGSLPSSPGSKRRFSSSSTPGASSASRSPDRLHRVLRVGLALGPAEVGARGDRRRPARAATRASGSAARMRRSSVIAPSRRAGR